MNETRWIRIYTGAIILTLAAVVLLGKLASISVDWWPWAASWAAVLAAGLLAIALLPLHDTVDIRFHRLAAALAGLALLIWLASGDSLSGTGEVLVLLAAVGVVMRSIARQRWAEARRDGTARAAMGARFRVAGIIVAVTVASFFYRWLVLHRLEQTSALFIGIPALLAILATLFARPKNTTGMLMTVMAIALLASGILLGEGFICILMASPLFFLIAAVVGAITDWASERDKQSQTMMSLVLIVGLTPMSMEGVLAKLSFPREEVVTRELVLAMPADEVQSRIADTPRFGAELPAFLRMGFPRPVRAAGTGLNIGDIRTIHFAGGEGKPGDLVMRVVEDDANSVEFEAVSDGSKVAHWMKWEETRFEWAPLPDGQTRVTCTVRYRRLLDPAWYFRPWERYAVGLSTEYLLHSMMAPR